MVLDGTLGRNQCGFFADGGVFGETGGRSVPRPQGWDWRPMTKTDLEKLSRLARDQPE